ncbi:MAG: hypothetical protein FWC40_09890 [Proteobacteria bacterium]|nr:hypothetical protein [Pseudomonadota bacterium]
MQTDNLDLFRQSLEHSFAGGNFREARIINGKPVRKGWYIDRRTGHKIETDL